MPTANHINHKILRAAAIFNSLRKWMIHFHSLVKEWKTKSLSLRMMTMMLWCCWILNKARDICCSLCTLSKQTSGSSWCVLVCISYSITLKKKHLKRKRGTKDSEIESTSSQIYKLTDVSFIFQSSELRTLTGPSSCSLRLGNHN